MTLPAPTLQSVVGKNIKHICGNEYVNNAHNHCAHFVAHLKGYSYGYTCKQQTGKGTGKGATIRVNDLFSQCPSVGYWSAKPANVQSCLVFVTDSTNVNLQLKRMTDHPQKHIGIFANGTIYHYSNGDDKVTSDAPTTFESKFKGRYSGRNITMYFGTFPL